MYQFVVSFTVASDHHDDFVRAARKVAQESIANEPGSLRFEVIADEENSDIFYLNEVYADTEAFGAHANGPYFAAFFADASAYAEGPVWLMKGSTVGEPASPLV